MIARVPGWPGAEAAAEGAPTRERPGGSTRPVPYRRRIFGWRVERAEHHRDPAVVAQVRDGLRAAAEQVEVGDGVLVEDRERVLVALRRDVDVAAGADGAVATKNIGCRSMNSRSRSLIASYSFATDGTSKTDDTSGHYTRAGL